MNNAVQLWNESSPKYCWLYLTASSFTAVVDHLRTDEVVGYIIRLHVQGLTLIKVPWAIIFDQYDRKNYDFW